MEFKPDDMMKKLMCAVPLAAMFMQATPATAVPVETVVLADFDTVLPSPTISAANGSNSSIDGGNDSFSAVAIEAESGNNKFKITDPGGFRNGAVITIPAAFSEPGQYLITADIKVGSTALAPINTYGMAAKLGSPNNTKVYDYNAGYVLNLDQNPTNGAALGYQTIGASIRVTEAGTHNLTLYFSTDPSGNPSGGTTGDFAGSHRGSGQSFPTTTSPTNTNAIYVDNIKRIGPGALGEERHIWISVGDGFTDLSKLESLITTAYNNGFNCINILARYRTNRYYKRNRDFSTYPNNEPAVTAAVDTNDPIQYAIDRGHELGMRVYASFSCFLATDGSTYPPLLPAGSINYVYNSGSPTPQTGSGLWSDPGRADVRAYNIQILMDLVQNYDLDGVIFDRIRYNSQAQDGYNPQALSEMGIAGTPAPSNANFIQKRQDAIAAFLHDAYVQVTNLKPWMVVGTVPIAYGSGMSETYNMVFQSWPTWSATPTANRTITFGAQDLTQPQFYRMWDTGSPHTAPAANRTLMGKALYGDTANDPMDFGLMPGNVTNVAPLFYTESLDNTTDAQNTANQLATNFCDARNGYQMNGFGTFSATPTLVAQQGASVISRLRAISTACGDVMAPATGAPLPDYLMKANWDNTPPNPVTGATISNVGSNVTINWPVPPPAADGEVPTRYLVYRSTSSAVKPYYANLVNRTTNITANSFTEIPPGGTHYYRVVAVDDYNNKATSTVIGPVTVASLDVIVESRLSGGGLNSTRYSESPALADTTSKSTAPGLVAPGARFLGSGSGAATFTPNLTAGLYNVYVTMGAGSNNTSTANWTITHNGASVTGSVNLSFNQTDLVNNWKLLASNVNFAAGTGGNITFTATSALSSTTRFVMDAVKFEYTGSSVADWQLY